MPSRWDSATCGRRRRVFHYPPPTLMSRNYRLPCAVELQPLSLTPLKMRKVEPRMHVTCAPVSTRMSMWPSVTSLGNVTWVLIIGLLLL